MDWTRLIVSLVLCQAAGAIGGFFTTRKIPTWYAGLVKPPFNPPSWVFGPVWTLLYLLMGYAFYLIWIGPASTAGRSKALIFFLVQLVLNVLWSYFFFELKRPWWAVAEMAFLWSAIVLTLSAFFPLSTRAGWLLVPYLAWVSFAFLLNWAIARLNPEP